MFLGEDNSPDCAVVMNNKVRRRGLLIVLCLTLLIGLQPVAVPVARAETVSVNVSPSTAQEGENVSISLEVSGALPGTHYEFTIAVLDPSTTLYSSTASYDTTSTQTSFAVARMYPDDFPPPASIRYVGSYQIFVDQIQPLATPNIASGSFSVTLAASGSYERTQTVQIRASGYGGGESVIFDIQTISQSVSGYPSSRAADSQGTILLTWSVPVNASLGTYTLTVNGTTTQKSPRDQETFQVKLATLTLTELATDRALYPRGEQVPVRLKAIYPDGSLVGSGSAMLNVRKPSGSVFSANASYNSIAYRFETMIMLNRTDEVGVWTVSISQGGLSDSSGNTGPSVGQQISLTVQIVQLQVSMSVGNGNLSKGDLLELHASVSYPDGTSVTTGTVMATILYQGYPIRDVSLRYYSDQGSWEGTYTVRSDDPSGDWTVRIDAADGASPVNTGSTFASVGITEPWLASSMFLYLIVVGVGVAVLLAFLYLSRRRVTRKQLKVDMQVIESEVRKIQEKDFFKSITDQLKEQGLDEHKEEDDQPLRED